MVILVEAVVPVVLCMALGKCLTYVKLFDSVDWPSLEKVMFWLFLPVLIFRSIVLGSFEIIDSLELATVFVIVQAAMAIGALAHARIAGLSAASMTSLFQNAVRWNNIIPIAVVSTVYGDSGMSLVAVALAVMVPIANVSCIVVLETALARDTSSWTDKCIAVTKNPLIVACIAGTVVRIVNPPMPATFVNMFDVLGSATLGVGLLVVGAGMSFSAIRRDSFHVALATTMKLVFMPLLTLCLGLALGLDGLPLHVAVLCTAAPTAMQGFIVARSMGGDAELMASTIATGHVVSVATMPFFLMLASRF